MEELIQYLSPVTTAAGGGSERV